MLNSENSLDKISVALIAYLRDEFKDSQIKLDTPLIQLQGGYEAYVYSFRLCDAPQQLSRPLVLRLYPQSYRGHLVVRESAVQNILVSERYPAPQVYVTCTDKSILGGPFIIMEYMPGENMLSAPLETIPNMLSATQVALHRIDPSIVNTAQVFASRENIVDSLDRRLDWLHRCAAVHPWLCDSVQWLIGNRPPRSEQLAICHGDFHPLNILIEGGKVTGVLDWPGCIIADPVLDVAFTMVYLTIPFPHLLPEIEWDYLARGYLDAYHDQRPLDLKYLDYYKVLRSITAFVDGADGQRLWQHPVITSNLAEYICTTTGIRVAPASNYR